VPLLTFLELIIVSTENVPLCNEDFHCESSAYFVHWVCLQTAELLYEIREYENRPDAEYMMADILVYKAVSERVEELEVFPRNTYSFLKVSWT